MSRRDLVAGAVLLVLVVALLAPVILTDRVYLPRHPGQQDIPWAQGPGGPYEDEPFNAAFSDKVNLIFPDVVHGVTEGQDGRLPIWNPYLFGGVPHAANPLTGVFYPPNWMFLLVKEHDADAVPVARSALHKILAIHAGFHVLLAGLFLFLYLRLLGCRTIPALVGGLAFAFSGWVAAHLQNTPLVAVVTWLPLGLYGVERCFQRNDRLSLILLSISLAMMWLAGMPQFAVLSTVALILYILVGLAFRWARDGVRVAARHGGWFLAFGTVGLLMASIQLLPTFELKGYSGHQARTESDLVADSMPPGGFVGACLPRVMGDPTQRISAEDRYADRIILGTRLGESARPNWSERTFYPGVLVLILAVLGLFSIRGRALWSIVMLGVLGALLCGCPPIIRLLSHIPVFAFGAPIRSVFMINLALAILAAFGFQVLMDRDRNPGRLLPIVTGVLAALLGVIAGWMWLAPERALEFLIEGMKSLGVERRLAGEQVLPVEAYMEAFARDFENARLDWTLLTAWVAAFFMLVLLWRLRPQLAGRCLAGVAFLVVLDLLLFLIPVNQPVKRDGLFNETPALRFLADNLGDDRLLRVSATQQSALEDAHRLFPPNMGLLFGLSDAQGWREQVPTDYLKLWEGVAATRRAVGISGIAADKADSPILDLCRVKYLVAARAIPALKSRLVFQPTAKNPNDLWIYENRDCLPRAYMVHEARCLPLDEARKALRESTIDPRKTVLVDQEPGPSNGGGQVAASPAATVEISDALPTAATFRVKTPRKGWLVITDSWYPDWNAHLVTDDGQEKPLDIVKAMTAFRAIPLDAGTHTIRMEYQPRSITMGLTLTALGCVGLLLSLFVRSGASGRPRVQGPLRREPEIDLSTDNDVDLPLRDREPST